MVRRSLAALEAVADGVDFTDRASWVARTAIHLDETLVDPDLEVVPPVEVPGVKKSYRGIEEFIGFMMSWTEGFTDWQVEVEELVDTGDDHVVAILVQRGTGKGSGVPVELRYAQIFTLNDGRVARIVIYASREQALEAAGLTE